ncbi:hypothetical protein V8G61_12350 [Gaetbulibacter sp. M240]|uniref:Nmad3 family putative nucleotide modification protein n=1 Tax=Gaetbulibacter sp. M240 TaxID=3126511 RepID=UPI00374E3C2C
MKVILSRKGFDSSYGGQPSPILPDGRTLLSLPIPQKQDTLNFHDLNYEDKTYYEIIKELSPKNFQINIDTCAHLDPDLRKDIHKNRKSNWKPLFGQSHAAQGHLVNQKVEIGDLFLFFGWFKETEFKNGKITYKEKAADLHVIFGYLQIGEIYKYGDEFPEYTKYHPHCNFDYINDNTNCIYVARDKLSFDNNFNGAGTLNFKNNLVLTNQSEGMSRSKWVLPEFFKNLKITYHSEKSFKTKYFQSANIGQEFVIQENEKLNDWVKEIITNNL